MRMFDVRFKRKVIRECRSGTGGYKLLGAGYDIADSPVRRWVGHISTIEQRRTSVMGMKSLARARKFRPYIRDLGVAAANFHHCMFAASLANRTIVIRRCTVAFAKSAGIAQGACHTTGRIKSDIAKRKTFSRVALGMSSSIVSANAKKSANPRL